MFSQLQSPLLIVNKITCKENIEKMFSKIEVSYGIFRPHFKTHNNIHTAQLFRDTGIIKITVTTPEMALKFINEAWDDITIAMPFNPHWISFLNSYNYNNNINIIVESTDVLDILIKELKAPCGIFIKVDVGTNRTGVLPQNINLIKEIINKIKLSKFTIFKGFLAHAGHTYKCLNKEEIVTIYKHSSYILNKLKKTFILEYPDIITSYGDTPSCSVLENLSGFDEFRPGNFVFYDLMQLKLGTCTIDNIAMAIACPVIAIHPERNELVIHGGSVHFSKEFVEIKGLKIYAQLAVIDNSTKKFSLIENAYLTGLSQEHGIVRVEKDILNNYKTGDSILLIPAHSCLTAYHMGNEYCFI